MVSRAQTSLGDTASLPSVNSAITRARQIDADDEHEMLETGTRDCRDRD